MKNIKEKKERMQVFYFDDYNVQDPFEYETEDEPKYKQLEETIY